MWTSNTLMKIETRVYSASARPPSPASSRGGGTLAIIVTSPSAGATISFVAARRGADRIAEEGGDPDRQADQQPAEEIG